MEPKTPINYRHPTLAAADETMHAVLKMFYSAKMQEMEPQQFNMFVSCFVTMGIAMMVQSCDEDSVKEYLKTAIRDLPELAKLNTKTPTH